VATVTVDEDPDRPDFPWSVVLDHAGAVTDLLERLHAEGARRVLLLTGTEDNAWNRRAGEAHESWARRHGLPQLRLSLYEGEGVAGAPRLVGPLLDGDDRPDAVVAAASRFAAGIAGAAAERGLRVPGDLMIAALTDSEYTRGHRPPITAVDLALEELAVASVDMMLRRLAGEDPPGERPLLHPVLHWRASTTRGTR
jgi:DNA-binding LacI/PurR family transcriptional regulator